jgi:hypothetical protein
MLAEVPLRFCVLIGASRVAAMKAVYGQIVPPCACLLIAIILFGVTMGVVGLLGTSVYLWVLCSKGPPFILAAWYCT